MLHLWGLIPQPCQGAVLCTLGAPSEDCSLIGHRDRAPIILYTELTGLVTWHKTVTNAYSWVSAPFHHVGFKHSAGLAMCLHATCTSSNASCRYQHLMNGMELGPARCPSEPAVRRTSSFQYARCMFGLRVAMFLATSAPEILPLASSPQARYVLLRGSHFSSWFSRLTTS